MASETAFVQGVAEAAASDRDLAAFYQANGYKPIWTGAGAKDRSRREAFLRAIADAPEHGLPSERYDPKTVKTNLRGVKSDRDLGRLEVELSRLFLRYARDIQTGVVTPSSIDPGMVREVPYRARKDILAAFAKSSPAAFIKTLPPSDPEYARLMKAKLDFEKIVGSGGWGPKVQAKKLEAGQSGAAVVALRNRLIAMGYLKRTASGGFDDRMTQAVAAFQRDHGLAADGVAGEGTLAEINVEPETRLASIIVAMERERWINMPRGKRHIWVNIADFYVKVVDDGKVTFETRSVVGMNAKDRRTPEFSDVMEHLIINPTWNVPRSIAVKEYLPLLQKDPYAAGNLRVIDAAGRTVPRDAVDFNEFTEATFPFDLKEPPNDGNALGLIKFMFPNRWNIYLHDTPAKNLFGRETRAYSHGCIRLRDPFDFAYTLLSRQTSDPQGLVRAKLDTGQETVVELEQHVPVHLDYRTAFTQAKGPVQFRRDVYGRDARIWQALQAAGVSLRAVRR